SQSPPSAAGCSENGFASGGLASDTSRAVTMPTSFGPPGSGSVTRRRRKPCTSISFAAWEIVVSGEIVTGCRVIHRLTNILSLPSRSSGCQSPRSEPGLLLMQGEDRPRRRHARCSILVLAARLPSGFGSLGKTRDVATAPLRTSPPPTRCSILVLAARLPSGFESLGKRRHVATAHLRTSRRPSRRARGGGENADPRTRAARA